MAAEAPASRRSLHSLDPETKQLLAQAPPLAMELHTKENLRFDPLRQELLALYGDEAAPNLLDPRLLQCAGRARDARLVSDSFLYSLIDWVAMAKAAELPPRTAAAKARHEDHVRAQRSELLASVGLPRQDPRFQRSRPKAPKRPRSSEPDDAPPPEAAPGLRSAVAALTLLLAKLDLTYELKLNDRL